MNQIIVIIKKTDWAFLKIATYLIIFFDLKHTDFDICIRCELRENLVCFGCIKNLKIDPREEYDCTRCNKKKLVPSSKYYYSH